MTSTIPSRLLDSFLYLGTEMDIITSERFDKGDDAAVPLRTLVDSGKPAPDKAKLTRLVSLGLTDTESMQLAAQG